MEAGNSSYKYVVILGVATVKQNLVHGVTVLEEKESMMDYDDS